MRLRNNGYNRTSKKELSEKTVPFFLNEKKNSLTILDTKLKKL